MAIGVALYRHQRRLAGQGGLTQPGNFAVIVGLLAGAAIGNKAVFLIEQPAVWHRLLDGEGLWPGQSIVGGLLGGLVGVEIAKTLSGQKQSTGDAMVWPLALGIAIGRVGCLLAGLHDDTFGNPSSLPWALDFGDSVLRHPTQLYDIAVVLALATAVHGRFARAPGLAFKAFLAGYLAWRWFIDGYKPTPHAYALGWSGIQWVCALALATYLPLAWRQWRAT